MSDFLKKLFAGLVIPAFLPFTILPSRVSQSNTKVPLIVEINLSYWGMQSFSEIGYISAGILHKKGEDKLIIYDVRRKRPVLKEPSGLRGKVPAFQGGFFLVDNFRHGNVNRLGGYFNSFAKLPSVARVTIGNAPDATPALSFSYLQKPPGFAGFWIHLFDLKIPPSERIFFDSKIFRYLTFSIRGNTGQEKLRLQIADRNWEKRNDSLEIGPVGVFLPSRGISTGWQKAWVPLSRLPDRINPRELASLVFIAREGQGQIYLKDVAFALNKHVEIPKLENPPPKKHSFRKGMWLWETKKLLKNIKAQTELVRFCRQNSLTDLFLQLPYKAEKKGEEWKIELDFSRLQPLILQLHRSGVSVQALDGAPHFALKPWHGLVLATIQTVLEYNRSSPAKARFDGIRYDTEPYLLPQFAGVQKQSIIRQYLEILQKSKNLADTGQIEYGIDIPFWYDERNKFFEPIAELDGRPLSEWILDLVDNVGIMDYRTQTYGADGTIAHTADELAYAASLGKKVFIGLETGSLPNETLLEFERSGGFPLLSFKKTGPAKGLLTWTESKKKIDRSTGAFLGQTSREEIPARKITFADLSLRDLKTVMAETRSELRKYRSFYGYAIHSYESYRPWLKRRQVPKYPPN